MNFVFPPGTTSRDQIQSRLLLLAAVFLILYSVVLTLSPVVRIHSWQVNYPLMHWLGVLIWLAGFAGVHRATLKLLPYRDPYLLPITGIISGWGLLTIWRLDTDFGYRQTAWLAVGLAVLTLIVFRPRLIVFLRRYKYLWLTCGLVITGMTFFFGTYPGGTGPHLWLGCCGFYLQPSEPLKLLLIIYLAAYLADRMLISLDLISLLFPTLILSGTALAILLAQRDLGTATLFIALYSSVTYLASGKKKILIISGIIILIAGFIGYQLFNVIQIRVSTWFNPWVDPSGNAYQIIQSLLAVAAGGVFGNGPGIGNPAVVPVAHSDFIFSAISEEFGLLGTVGLIILFGMLVVRGLNTAVRAPNQYQRFLASGITVNLVAQGILIIGGNLSLLPLTGVTLPFVSYGGSSLLTSFVSMAILLLISSQKEEEVAPLVNSRPFVFMGSLLLFGLFAIGTVNMYWGFLKSGELQDRTDNPRWAITDRYVPRGQILDRNNKTIAVTSGFPGNYSRSLLHAPLGPVIGYSSPLYGLAGLEASLDPYLRGLEGNPTSTITAYHLLHGQTPPGLDVRLSLDIKIQQLADSMLIGKSGSLVLLNTQTGEILAMSSYPGFNPDLLDENWKKWMADPGSVFLNRASQGQYSPGTALGPFILASVLSQESLPAIPTKTSLNFNGVNWDCGLLLPNLPTWGDIISHGCPGAINDLGQRLKADQINQLMHQLELDRAPDIMLPVAQVTSGQTLDTPERLALGQGKISVSPLQMALAAASLAPTGEIPTPRIAMAVNTPLQGWVALPSTSPPVVTKLNSRNEVTQLLQMQNLPAWQVTATAQTSNGNITWFLAGTVADWKGAPLTLALVLEENDPISAHRIGTELLKTILLP